MKSRTSLLLVTVSVVSGGLLRAADEVKAPGRIAGARKEVAAARGLEARMFLRHAKDRLENLLLRVRTEVSISNEEAQDLAAAVKQDLHSSDAALDKLREQFAGSADVVDWISQIRQQLASGQELNTRLAAEFARKARDSNALTDGSWKAWSQLDAADVELGDLLRSLKIYRVIPSRAAVAGAKVAPSAPPPSTADGTATLGEGFRPRTATAYHRAALDHAGVLADYGESQGEVPDDTILEHLSEIERQLSSLKAEYAKLDDGVRKEKDLERNIKAMEENQAAAQKRVDSLKKSAETRQLNPAELKEVSNLIYQNLRKSMTQHYVIMNNGGVQHGGWHNEPLYDP
jgi:hypothetical protein